MGRGNSIKSEKGEQQGERECKTDKESKFVESCDTENEDRNGKGYWRQG